MDFARKEFFGLFASTLSTQFEVITSFVASHSAYLYHSSVRSCHTLGACDRRTNVEADIPVSIIASVGLPHIHASIFTVLRRCVPRLSARRIRWPTPRTGLPQPWMRRLGLLFLPCPAISILRTRPTLRNGPRCVNWPEVAVGKAVSEKGAWVCSVLGVHSVFIVPVVFTHEWVLEHVPGCLALTFPSLSSLSVWNSTGAVHRCLWHARHDGD